MGDWQLVDKQSPPGWELKPFAQSWFTDQRSKSLQPITFSTSYTFSSLNSSKCFNSQSVWQFAKSSQWNTSHPCSSGRLKYLFHLIPMANPETPIVGFSNSLALLSQVEEAADSFQPRFINMACDSRCEAIRERKVQPLDTAAILFSVKSDEKGEDKARRWEC